MGLRVFTATVPVNIPQYTDGTAMHSTKQSFKHVPSA